MTEHCVGKGEQDFICLYAASAAVSEVKFNTPLQEFYSNRTVSMFPLNENVGNVTVRCSSWGSGGGWLLWTAFENHPVVRRNPVADKKAECS